MTELYRFRSINSLLGEFNELENQSIYFASPEELNDPLEGFRNIFWQGDQIVWRNFFKHYIYCLLRSTFRQKLSGDSITRHEFERLIPVEERRDEFILEVSQNPSIRSNELLGEIYNRVFEKYELGNFIIELVRINRKVRSDEVLVYLQVIHSVVVSAIYDVLDDTGFKNEFQSPHSELKPESIVNTLGRMVQADGDVEALEKVFELANQFFASLLLLSRLSVSSMSQKTTEENQCLSNDELLLITYPNSFLKQLVNRLIYPRWYAACFVRECNNSSIWGHYADGHKGVCLIFETGDSEERTGPTITLNKLTRFNDKEEVWSDVPMPIYDINYVAQAGEIDFFRSIGWLQQSTLEEFWYCDEEGNISECGSHLRNNNINAWKTDYWKVFFRDITAKTKDWKYEKESRMILTSSLFDLSDKKWRTLTYNFKSLKGIIFGINTSTTDKLKVIEIIKNKCQENNRKKFEFFQAYYDHGTGRIQNRNLHLN